MRTDLRAEALPGRRPRRVMVIDELGGRFFRVRQSLWDRLTGNDQQTPLAASDIATARACHWTRERTGREREFRWSKLLAFPLPLGSADALARRCRWITPALFDPVMAVIWLTSMGLTLAFLAGRIEALADDARSLPMHVATSGKCMALVVLLVTKLAHEWGHAVMCRRMGAHPKSFGVMLFFGFPCPYCDVTDSYRLTSRDRRIAVMAAGMYVECLIATIAAWVWLVSPRGGTAAMSALHIMATCGISTLIFNGNPLARYDGYFIASDLAGSVDLRSDARDRFHQLFRKPVPAWNRNLLVGAIYHVASLAYRYVLLVSIGWAIYAIADTVGAGRLVLAIAMASVILMVSLKIARRWSTKSDGASERPATGDDAPKKRRALSRFLWACLAFVAITIPLPDDLLCEGQIEFDGASEVFIPIDSSVENVEVVWGAPVAAGQRLAELRSETMEHQRIQLASALAVQRTRAQLIRQASIRSDEAASQWATADANQRSSENQLAALENRLRESKLIAPIDGRVIASRSSSRLMSPSPDDVTSVVRAGQAWCRIARREHMVAELVIPQSERHRVRIGTPVQVLVSSWWTDHGRTTRMLATTVESISTIKPPASQDESLIANRRATQTRDPTCHDETTTEPERSLRIVCRLSPVGPKTNDTAIETRDADAAGDLRGEPAWWALTGAPCEARIEQPSRSIAQRWMDHWRGD